MTKRATKFPKSFTSPTVSISEGRVLFLVVAATSLVFANSLGSDFVFDDIYQIVGNPQLRSWSNVRQAFTTDIWSFRAQLGSHELSPPYYRPIHSIYMTVCFQLFGLWTQGWHLISVTTHVFVTLVAYYLVRRLSGQWQIAAVAAILFSINPTRAESVAWISGITDPLMALFYLGAMLSYVYYREGEGRLWLVSSVVLFALACLSKEVGITLPLLIVAWEVSRSQRAWKTFIPELALLLVPYVAVATAYLAARHAVLGSAISAGKGSCTLLTLCLSVPYILVQHLQHQIAPAKLSLVYDVTFVTTPVDLRAIVPTLLLLLVLFFIWVIRRRITTGLWTALALMIVPLLPALNLQLLVEDYLLQDRYFYVSSVGLSWLAATLIVAVARQHRLSTIVVVGTLTFALGSNTMAQNVIWSDSRLLWERGAERAPHKVSTHINLGLAYYEHGEASAAHKAFLRVLELERDDKRKARTYTNISAVLISLNEPDQAIAAAKKALQIVPSLPEANNNLGLSYKHKGDYEAAHEQLRKTLEIEPRYALARANFAIAKASLGDHKGAARQFEIAIAQLPDNPDLRYRLAMSYIGAKENTKAAAQLEQFLQTEQIPEVVTALRNQIKLLREAQNYQ